MSVGGRPALTSARDLAEVAQTLFLRDGFDNVTVEDIARAAGVSSRTFFRHFTNKADVLWVESPADLTRLRDMLAAQPVEVPYQEALIATATAALHHPPERHTWALQRARLILSVPAVQERAALRHHRWRHIATEFVAHRRGTGVDDIVAVATGHAVLAATLAAHEYWIAHPDQDLQVVMEQALRVLLLPAP